MSRQSRVVGALSAIAAVLGMTVLAAAPARAADERSVLLIYADPRLSPNITKLDETLRTTIGSGAPFSVRFDTEYLDLSWFPQGQERYIREAMRAKYTGRAFDLVIPCGEAALRFALRERDVLFAEVPIAFCAVEDGALHDIGVPSDVTGVTMFRDWTAGLDLIMRLHPGTRRIAFVGGASPMEKGWETLARAAFKRTPHNLEFTYITGLPLEETEAAVIGLPPETVIIFNGLLLDGKGRPFSSPEALRRLAPAASVPIYGFADTQLGHGIVGGPLVSDEGQAQRAGQLALRILAGERLGRAEIVRRAPSTFSFDARELARWRIRESRLPPGSIVHFRPVSLWRDYRWHVGAAIAFAAAQFLLIAGLLIGRRQRRRVLADLFAVVLMRRGADRALEASESRFHELADAAPVMMWIAGPDGRRVDFNRTWLRFTGRTLAEEVGDLWRERVHVEDRAACLMSYRAAVEARRPFTIEYRLRRADGVYRSIVESGVPSFDGDTFRGYMGSAVDITDVKAAQHAMMETLALRSAIVGSLYGQLAAVDRKGVIIAVNEAWTQFMQERGGDAHTAGVGANYLDVCHRAAATGDPHARAALEAIESVLDGRSERALVEYPCATSSETQWYAMVVEPFKRPEGGLVISHINVTRRRRAEEDAQRERQDLAHALRVSTLGDLATALAHEINQPLAAIATNAQAARRMVESAPVDPDVLAALSDIADGAHRAAQVIRRLRVLFKKESGDPQPVDLTEVIKEVLALLHKDLERRRVRVHVSLPPDLPRVRGDVVQLQQVILNVVVNAAEAMTGTVHPRDLRVSASAAEPAIFLITVSDTGPGVPAPELEHIFERFVTSKSDGLGMGLSISRSIITAHGGRMWATRNTDRGLTLHIELPYVEE